MTDKPNKTWRSMSDPAILVQLGEFVRRNRLQQNKTQAQLAEEAGINRSTLVEVEQGKGCNLITFVQLLRALQQLQVLEAFEEQPAISPLKLAEEELKRRQRAGRSGQS
ncbi:MAG: helix-turn-helix transcriptional regulator [Flavobacteriales bacterium]|nr:helix-turn-helix transcriptional regulator [Flavobacteriales bacterium]MCB9447909.1 helix-turn-helix transcriptional regulator [Flavobacteriales bacterium]